MANTSVSEHTASGKWYEGARECRSWATRRSRAQRDIPFNLPSRDGGTAAPLPARGPSTLASSMVTRANRLGVGSTSAGSRRYCAGVPLRPPRACALPTTPHDRPLPGGHFPRWCVHEGLLQVLSCEHHLNPGRWAGAWPLRLHRRGTFCKRKERRWEKHKSHRQWQTQTSEAGR